VHATTKDKCDDTKGSFCEELEGVSGQFPKYHMKILFGDFGDHQCGFRRNRSNIVQIFFIRQILDKKWQYNGTVHQLFIDFRKAYDSVRREVLYKILIEFGVRRKLVRLIKMCLNETYSKIRVGKHLSCAFPIKNGLKEGGCSITIAFQLFFRICHQEGPRK
jgi:hypothetical protein